MKLASVTYWNVQVVSRPNGLTDAFRVALASVMLVAAWVVTIGLRRFAARFGLLRYVWHPSVFAFAIYMIVLSSMVLLVAAR